MAFDDLNLPSGDHPNVVGGSATYAAMAATLFAPARVVAVVGEDFPEATLSELQQRGADTAGVERAKGKTFRWAGKYSENLASRETLSTELNVFADFRPKLPDAYLDSPFLLLGNIQPALQMEVLEQARAAVRRRRHHELLDRGRAPEPGKGPVANSGTGNQRRRGAAAFR
jgi:sugar/nucleoside kinase (ribokinase family)